MSQSTFSDPNVSVAVALTGTGNGTLTVDRLTHFSIAQAYTVTCIATSPDVLFSVVGSLDGAIGIATAGTQFFDDELKIFFTIANGGTAFIVGDYFTFTVAAGTDLNQTNIDAYDELPQKNFGAGTSGSSAGDHNVRYSNTSLASSLFLQDLKFTAVTAGSGGDAITVAYTTGGTAGSEAVSVVSNAISVQIESGVSTATQIKSALDGDGSAAALISTAIIGLASNPQFGAVSATNLTGGKNKNFALNHSEITDSGSFVEGNANLKARTLALLGDLDVAGHSHLQEVLSLNDAVAAHGSGNAIPNVQKAINRLISAGKIQINTVGSALIAWDGGDLSCSANIQIRLRDGSVVNTVDMTGAITLADGESTYVILNPEASATVAVVVASTVSTNALALRLATRFGTDLIMFNGTVLAANEGAKLGSGGSATASVAGSVVRRDSSGDFAANDATLNKAIVAPGAGNGVDVSSAGDLEIGATVGANDVTIGAASSRVVIPGDLEVQGTTTTVDTTNLIVKDKLVTINNGGSAASGGGSGIEVEEDSSITGYVKTASDRNGWEFKAPNSAGVTTLTPGSGTDAVVLAAASQTLTGKTIDGDDNTVSDLPETAIKTNVTNASKFFTRDGSGVPESATKAVPSGDVVGTSDTQTLSAKTFSDAITGAQIATPSNPASTYNKLYFKDDDELYKLDSAGNEVKVGTGAGGSGGINYILNPDAETDATGWATYADAAGVVPVDGTGGSPVRTLFAASATDPLRGDKSFVFTRQAGGSGQGEGASYDFEIDDADRAKVLSVSFDALVFDWDNFIAADGITPPANSGPTPTTGNSTIGIFIYDVTNAVLIPLSPSVITSNSLTIPQTFKGTFQTASNSTSYRLILHTCRAEDAVLTVRFDNFFVGPQSVAYGSAITDWQSYTPTSSWTANTTMTGRYRRVGDSMEIIATASMSGAPTTATFTVSLPSGFTMDSSKLPGGGSIGDALGYVSILDAGSQVYTGTAYYASSTTINVTYGAANGAGVNTNNGVVNQANPMTVASGDLIGIHLSVPIAGWSSNTLMSNDTDTRVVDFVGLINSGTHTSTGNWQGVPNYTSIAIDTHSGSIGSGLYRIPVSGRYHISAKANVASNTTGSRGVRVLKNSTNVNGGAGLYPAGGNTGIGASISIDIDCVSGDEIKFQAFQSSGGNLNYETSADSQSSFTIHRLTGPATIAASETVAAIINGAVSGTIATHGSQSIAIYATKVRDTHSAYNTTTGFFTVPVSGFYDVTGRALWTFSSGQPYQYGYIYVDSTLTQSEYYYPGTAANAVVKISGMVYAVAGQTISVRYSTNGSSVAYDNSVPTNNYLAIKRVGN